MVQRNCNQWTVLLNWTPSTAATGYNVKRSTNGSSYVVIATNLPETTYTDSNLSSNSPNYYYEVSAINSFGESPNTPPVTASLAPPAPGWQSVILVSQQFVLRWTTSAGATGYNLKRSTDGNNYFVIATNLATTNFTDSNVVDGATYYYKVAAANSFGEGFYSAPIGVTVVTPPTHIEAESYTSQSGTQTENCSEGTLDVGYIESGDWCRYNGVNFGPGTLRLNARVASAGSGGTIEVRLGATNGTLVGVITVPVTGGWQTWTTMSTALTNVSGVQNLVMRFVGGGGYLFNANWLEFTPDLDRAAAALLAKHRRAASVQLAVRPRGVAVAGTDQCARRRPGHELGDGPRFKCNERHFHSRQPDEWQRVFPARLPMNSCGATPGSFSP